MTDWMAMTPEDEVIVDDEGVRAQVVRPEEDLFVVRRHFDGSWQNTVWIREMSNGWSLAREVGTRGMSIDDIREAISHGIVLSREALAS